MKYLEFNWQYDGARFKDILIFIYIQPLKSLASLLVNTQFVDLLHLSIQLHVVVIDVAREEQR